MAFNGITLFDKKIQTELLPLKFEIFSKKSLFTINSYVANTLII